MQFNILYCFNNAFTVEQYGIMFNVCGGGGRIVDGEEMPTPDSFYPLFLSCYRKINFKMTLHF